MTVAAPDLIAGYLAEMGAGLWVPAAEAELILAEAEDHLRETAAAGLAAGMTELEAQQAAISSFGPVRAVIWAHRRRRVTARDAALAAWKLAALLATTVGAGGLAGVGIFVFLPHRIFVLHSASPGPPGIRSRAAADPGGPGPSRPGCDCVGLRGHGGGRPGSASHSPVAARRAGPARPCGPGPAGPGGNGELLPAGIGAAGRAHRERRGGAHRSDHRVLEHPDRVGLHLGCGPRTGCRRRRLPGRGCG